jgi:serine/threonine protein kinase
MSALREENKEVTELASELGDIVNIYDVNNYPKFLTSMADKKLSKQITVHSKKTLGEGGFGSVYLGCCKNKAAKMDVAVKIFSKHCYDTFIESIAVESHLLTKWRHENILHSLGLYKKKSEWCLALEYMSKGNLRQLILDPQHKISQEQIAYISYSVCNAVEFIHSKNIMHRDIKPDNILISAGNQVKLSDFGTAECTVKFQFIEEGHMLGTIPYAPPEQWAGMGYNQSVDIWAMGIVFCELITGIHYAPFTFCNNIESTSKDQEDDSILQIKIKSSLPLKSPLKVPTETSALELDTLQSDLVLACLNTDPDQRPKATHLKAYFKQFTHDASLPEKN